MNTYENWVEARKEAKLNFAKALKKHLLVSSPNKGDYEVEMDTLQEKIDLYEKKIQEYEDKHPEYFIDNKEKTAAPEKMIRQSQKNRQDIATALRPSTLTEEILEKMLTNTFIHAIEQTLSTQKKHWDAAKIALPEEQKDSYAFWYCYFQAENYRALVRELWAIQWGNYKIELRRLMNTLEQRNMQLKAVLPADKTAVPYRSLIVLERCITHTRFDLITCADNPDVWLTLQRDFKNHIEKLIYGLLNISEEAINCLATDGRLENTEQLT